MITIKDTNERHVSFTLGIILGWYRWHKGQIKGIFSNLIVEKSWLQKFADYSPIGYVYNGE